MHTVAFDTHAAVRKLRDAGFTERQAETLVEVISDAIGGLMTKAELDAAPANIKAEFAAFKRDMKAEFAALKANIKAEFATVRARKDTLGARLT